MPDREKIIKELEEIKTQTAEIGLDSAVIAHKFIDKILVMLKEQDAVNKNIGEWKNGHCSCCGEDVSSMLDTWTNVQKFLFCPNCGAKMEGR